MSNTVPEIKPETSLKQKRPAQTKYSPFPTESRTFTEPRQPGWAPAFGWRDRGRACVQGSGTRFGGARARRVSPALRWSQRRAPRCSVKLLCSPSPELLCAPLLQGLLLFVLCHVNKTESTFRLQEVK